MKETRERRESIKCLSCDKELDEGSVVLNCPACGKHKIARCWHCRKISVRYKCPSCGFEGP